MRLYDRRKISNLRSLNGRKLSAFKKEDFPITLFAWHVAYWAHVRFYWLTSQSWSASCNSKDEILLRIQVIWNSLPQVDIQNLFDTMPCCIAACIAAHGGYTKYWFLALFFFFLLWNFYHLFVQTEVVY